MTASLYAKPSGTQGALQVNGADVVLFGPQGIESGVQREAVSKMPTLGAQVTLAGTAVDFNGIPNWVNEVDVLFRGASLNGASGMLVQLGTSAGIVNSGYYGRGVASCQTNTVVELASGAGIPIRSGTSSGLFTGVVALRRVGGTTWIATQSGLADGYAVSGGSDIILEGTLDRVRLTSINGTDTYDLGKAALVWR